MKRREKQWKGEKQMEGFGEHFLEGIPEVRAENWALLTKVLPRQWILTWGLLRLCVILLATAGHAVLLKSLYWEACVHNQWQATWASRSGQKLTCLRRARFCKGAWREDGTLQTWYKSPTAALVETHPEETTNLRDVEAVWSLHYSGLVTRSF